MTATDELRRMLDERGVEYRWDNGTATWYVDGVMYNAWGYDNERLTMSVCKLTPEQGVRMARASGECEMDVLDTGNEAAYEHYEYIMHCANCHHEFGYVQYNEDGDTWMDDKPNHCPNCGKAVKR